MPSFVTREFYRNEIIFKEGSKGNVAYILVQGSVSISTVLNQKEMVLAQLEPVAVFGEMALLMDEGRRTATAKALRDSTLVEVPKETFETYLKESPKFITAVLNTLVNRLKSTTTRTNRIPDPFLATCEILDLFAAHGQLDLHYQHTIESIAEALMLDASQVENQLNILKAFGFLDYQTLTGGRKLTITLLKPEGFSREARKVYQEIGGFELSRPKNS